MELRDALTLAIMVPSVSKPEGWRRGRGGRGGRRGREGGRRGAVKKEEDETKRRGIYESERNGKDKKLTKRAT